MSGRPVTGEVPPVSAQGPSNSNGGASGGGHPPKADTAPQSFPMATVPRLPPAVPMDTSQQQDTSIDAPKIPPLMGIRPNISSLNPPPPVQLPPPPTLPSAQPPITAPVATQQPTLQPPGPSLGGNQPPGPSVAGEASVVATATASPPKAPSTQAVPQGVNHPPPPGVSTSTSMGGVEIAGKQMREEGSNGVHPKLPILRLKKKGGDDDSFEKQDSSKNDSYCWVCHDGGDVLCCDNCPRVFHLQCSGVSAPPDDEENEWFCSVCKNIARKTKRSRPQNLRDLLLLAVERMMFPGTEIFQAPVPPDIMTHYREYVFFPMHLGKIKEKVSGNLYQSTREFTHDTEWILHNCIIYNGAKHALTKIAKNIVKVCKEDMREIELCPGCYKLTVKQPKDWFSIPCNPPHRVVLAKVRGYPLWPAKLISETSDKCDVRFFGQHDRSLVPKCDISALSGLPPKPSTKTKHWNQAMFELKKYRENIETMRDQLGKDKPIKMMMKNKFGKQGIGGSGGGSPLKSSDKESSSGGGGGATNHHSFPPAPVVEVTPSSDGDGPGSYSDADVSSPGTPPSLQIDLDGSGGSSRDKSPNRGRAMPSGGRSLIGGAIGRTQVPGSLDFNNDGGASSVVVRSPMANSKVNRKGMKAGAALSALVSSLTQRKRVAEQVGALTPVRQGAAVRGETEGGGLGVPMQEDSPADAGKKSAEVDVDKTKSPFSSMYELEKKTGLVVVDPNQKRPKRKTTKMVGNDPPPAKRARISANPLLNSDPTPESNSKSDTDSAHIGDPAAFVAKVQEYSSAAINALSSSTPPSISTPSATSGSTPHTVASLKASAARSSLSASPQNTSGSSSGSGGGAASLGLPGLPKSRTVGGPRKKTGAKRGGGDKNRGKSPHKGVKPANASSGHAASNASPQVSAAVPGVSSALAALINAPTGTTPTAAVSSAATSTASSSSAGGGAGSARAQFLSQVAGTSSTTPTTAASITHTATTAEIRGEAPTPRLSSEEINNFAEGSGLLADTIRKVNTSFLARVNQMTGQSDDMGYKYFVEKLMASIKTVIMEMLSSFDAKSRMSAKQLREQLHQGWPVSNSSVAIEQLGKELRDEMKQSLEVVRASAALELEQVVNEVRRQVEKEKEIAIAETKKMKWCSYCLKEAQYNCCWNANYCNEVCQQAHWPDHMDSCTQVQHQVQAGRLTPAAAQTPTQKTTPLMTGPGGVGQQQQQQQQLSPTLAIGGGSSGGTTGVPSQGLVGGPPTQDPQQGYLFTGAAAAAAQAQSQAQAQAQSFAQAQAQAQAQQVLAQQPGPQGGVAGGPQGAAGGQQGRMSPMAMVNHTPGNAAQQSLQSSLSGGSSGGGATSHALHSSHHHPQQQQPQQQLRGAGGGAAAGLRHDQHHSAGSPLLHVDSLHSMDTLPPGGGAQMPGGVPQQQQQQQMEKSVTHSLEQIPSDGGLITTANTASPPNHIRNILLGQHHQQNSKSAVITSTHSPNIMLGGHQSPAPPQGGHGGVHTPPMGAGGAAGGGELHPSLSNRSHGSDHSSNSTGIIHPAAAPPMSPVTPPAENPSSVHAAYGGWTYPHQHSVLIGANDTYPHLLPTMQANTPTSQNHHAYFKAAY